MTKRAKIILLPANILFFLAITFFIMAIVGKQTTGEAYIGAFDTFDFSQDWILYDEQGQNIIQLPTVLKQYQDTVIVLENTLPYYVSDGMRLSIRTALQDIYIYVGDELRSSYCSENIAHVGEYLPSAYVMADLTKQDAGKKIQIHITIKEQAKINEVRIGYGNNVWFSILSNNIAVVVAATILVAVGFFAVILHMVMRKVIVSSKAVLFLGQAMMVIGFWIISESNMRQLIFRTPSYSAIFAYMFIELIGGFVALYFDEIQGYKYHKAYLLMEILIFGQAALNTILALFGIVEFYITLPFAHLWMLVGVAMFMVTVIMDIRSRKIKEYSITALGMLLFVLFCIFEIFGFYFKDFYILGVYLCIGLIILLIATVTQIVRKEFERIKQTIELEKAKENAENANRTKTEFLARMSHEIRTPINAVIGMNEMIIRESHEENVRKYANDVKSSSAHLLSIVNEILDTSKIEFGMLELTEGNYKLGYLLNDVYNIIAIKAREKGLELIFDVDTKMPSEYLGDDLRMKQVLINLLTNAVKYTKQGMVLLRLGYEVEKDEAILHFAIKDTGIGIKKEDIDKIYDEFQRLDSVRNRGIEGSGLGMKITQQILNLMGSELHIQSEYERGSEFSFAVKQKIVSHEALGEFREYMQYTKNQESERSEYVAPQAKVLVVDDYSMNLKVFKNLLKQTQIQVTIAESGIECLELLKKQTFHMIFMDHMMPEMDGIETLHRIKELNLCDGVPIIMLTANAIVGDREKYIDERYDEFLSKPIIPGALDKIILEYLPQELVIKDEALSSEGRKKMDKLRNELYQSRILNELYEKLPELNVEAGLATCSGDEEFYLELLQDFVELTIKEELTKFAAQSDYKNYCIRIHGFKNSAYSLGAKELGDLAYNMECISREQLPEEVLILQKKLFEQYDRICKQYKDLV